MPPTRPKSPARTSALLAAALVFVLAAPPGASAQLLEDCHRKPEKRRLAGGYPILESIGVDRRGRIYFSESGEDGKLHRLGRRGRSVRVVASGIPAPGGMLRMRRGPGLLVGFGSSIPGGLTGNLDPQAGLVEFDPRTGTVTKRVDGLAMANGVARGPGGVIYASNDVGFGLDRVERGVVTNNWARIYSANGITVDPEGRWLYAATTFRPARIQRVNLAKPSRVEDWFVPPPLDIAAGLDGMTRDRAGNLYVAANAANQIWRIDRDGEGCVLARNVSGASDVAFGHRRRDFGRRDLYAVGFGGSLVELPNAVRARAPR